MKLRGTKDKHYSADFPEQYMLSEKDILVVMTDLIQSAPLLGGALIVPEDNRFLHNQRLGLVQTEGKEPLDRGFLYYLLNSPGYKAQVRASATGATVRHTAPTRIENCNVTVPNDPAEQRAIAEILEWHDVTISQTSRQIELLEEAARLIYTEWFVRLRIPGHIPPQHIDELPQGWTKTRLMELADVFTGYSFKGEFFNEMGEGEPVIRIRDIPNQRTNTWSTESCPSEYFVEEGDLLIGMDGFFHMANWAGQRGYLVQRVCRIRAKDPAIHAFLSLALERPIKYLEETIVGATVAHLGLRHLKEIDIALPPMEDLGKLELFDDLLKQRLCLQKQITQLRQARDLLLPRLISGQLRL